jgi:hypothetical protein
MSPWLARLRHDLIKRALWPARDVRALLAEGTPPSPQDLAALRAGLLELRGPDGTPCDASTLLQRLLETAPDGLLTRCRPQLGALAAALAHAQQLAEALPPARGAEKKSMTPTAATGPLLEALFALEQAFDRLCSAAP